jgi:kynurenine formamidase
MAGAHDVAGLENLTSLDALPTTGILLLALPMKIEGGSGGPARVVALLPE